MSPVFGRRRGDGDPGPVVPLAERSEKLASALDVGGDELEPGAVEKARGILTRSRERWALKGGRTVVALAGATGSGKSSLFNALVGADVSTISPRRPTTSAAAAAIWGEEDSGELLDWLGIHNRHHVPTTGDNVGLDGLVLVDLPDFDSLETANRVEADRILERADVFVWVTDPQKYADARLHDEYLRPLRHHDTVMLVVLNQVDRIADPSGAERIRGDLRRLVAADGAGDHEVIGTSTRTGEGLDVLQTRIGEVVRANSAAEARLVADVRSAAEQVGQGVGSTTPELTDSADGKLHAALKTAAGIPVVLDAVERDYRRQSATRAGWPFTRWMAALRPDPLKRLRLGDDSPGESGVSPSDVRAVLGRSSLPAATQSARANVRLASQQVAEDAAAGLPPRWADAVAEAASPTESTLSDALDQAVVSTPLRTRDPLWWPVFGVLQLLFAAVALVGLVWLAAYALLNSVLGLAIGVPVIPSADIHLPIPLLLLVGGLLAGLLLALLAKVIANVGARRRRDAVEADLDEAVDQVSYDQVRRPVMAVLDRHEKVRQLLQRAGA